MTLKYIWRSFSLGCHFHVHFSYPWHAFASHGLPAIAELFVLYCNLSHLSQSSHTTVPLSQFIMIYGTIFSDLDLVYSILGLETYCRNRTCCSIVGSSENRYCNNFEPRYTGTVYYVCVLMWRLRPSLNFVHWNTEGWKTGLCSVAPVGHPYSLLTLANNTCVWHNFQSLRDRFVKLYKRKVNRPADELMWYWNSGVL